MPNKSTFENTLDQLISDDLDVSINDVNQPGFIHEFRKYLYQDPLFGIGTDNMSFDEQTEYRERLKEYAQKVIAGELLPC